MILYKSQKRLLKKYFVSLHCEKLFVINGGYPGGETSRLANIVWHETYTTKSVHNFHNDAIRPRLFFRTFEDYIDKQLKVSVSEFVTVSHSCAQSLKVRKNLVEVEPLVIYNGIDSLSFRNRSLIENYLNKRSCIFIANYEPRKGHDFLFRVMEKVRQIIPDVSLDIYGAYDADQFENVKSLWLKNSPDLNVNLNGFKADIMLELQKFDVLLICSQEFESFGLTAIEAMAQGIPVVSTDVGGLKEVVGFEGNGGFLFDKFDIDGYSSKVIELLLNKDLRRLIGIRGIDNVRNKFSLNQMVIKYKKLIR
jgi:glycosyltransferase involved in cell wall biosynthesis